MSEQFELDDQVPVDGIDLVLKEETNMLTPVALDSNNTKGRSFGNLDKENGFRESISIPGDDYDEFVQMVIELKFQNEYLKSQFEVFKNQHLGSTRDNTQETEIGGEGLNEDVKELQQKIITLNRQLEEQRETQKAAEDAMKHLHLAYSEADAKAQELSIKLTEAQQKMDGEIRERDDKYTELDSKFGRLHKRAKQRIQDIQKEKDDLEARLRDVNEMAEQASSKQLLAQQELERTRQQASEALRSLDVERQQLRTTNNRLRDSVNDLQRALEAKESTLEGLQSSLSEKEEMLVEMQDSLRAADEKNQALIAEISAKHQKHAESLEAQLADALADRSKADQTISSLQVLIAAKESKIAEMDAASTGEAVRLRAALEAAKGELIHLKNEHAKERESWDSAYQGLVTKLEAFESTYLRSEIEAAKMRSQFELELAVQNQLLNSRDAELVAAKEEISRIKSEFSSYKVRAHALLQKKDADLAAAKDSEQIRALEEAVKAAEGEVVQASSERDRALQALQDALTSHEKELATRDAALIDAEQWIKTLVSKFDSFNAQYVLEEEAWQKRLENMEGSWRLKFEALKAQNSGRTTQDLQEELEGIKLQCKRLKEEHDSFRDIADGMIEEKDREISRLINDNNNLQRLVESRKSVKYNGIQNTAFLNQDAQLSATAAAEQQILLLARQQAQREEELAQSQRHILALQEEIEELERENRLHSQQEAMLKTEFRNMERMQKREGVDMTYLKNVILKLLETGEVEALLPVIGTLLQFSPEEIRKCQEAYHSTVDVPLGSPAAIIDATASGPRSLLSRFSFT